MTFVKQNKVIALALAFLMLVATVFVAAGSVITAFGVEEDTRNLQITFDSETCQLFYTVDGIEKEMVSGTAYAIPFGAQNVLVEVKPKDGYTLKGDGGIFTSEDFKPETQKLNGKETGETVYTISRFNEDHTYYVRCVNRTFSIKFVPSLFASGGTSIDYEFEGSAPNLSITYKTESISIPTPQKIGHTFKGWTIVNKDGSEPGIAEITNGVLSSEILTDDMLQNNILYLRANFTKNKYDVTRFDFVYSESGFKYTGKQLGSYSWKVEMDTYLESATAGGTAEEGDKATLGYPGYEIRMGMSNPYTKCTVNVTDGGAENVLIRYYDPIVYLLKFDSNGGVAVPDGAHTFNADTVLPTTTRVGYTFNGWTVIVDGKEVGTVTVNGDGKYVLAAENAAYAATEVDEASGKRVIHLTAKWEANRYPINYSTAGGTLANGTPVEHVYDGVTVIPDPVRTGYVFKGWRINGSNDLTVSTNGSYTLSATQLPDGTTEKIEMVAVWEAKQYTITLNANAGSDTVTGMDASISTTFDAAIPNLTQIPSRVGYRFLGFATAAENGTPCIGADGKGIGSWTEDTVTTLYAQWEALPFEITILGNNPELVDSVKINGVAYTLGETYTIRYRETVSIEIVMKDGYKLVSWMGGKQAHDASVTVDYQHLIADNKTVSFMVLPVISAPTFVVDYQKEIIVTTEGAIPAGRYSIYDESGTLWRTLLVDENGVMSLNGVQVDAISIPENFFGTTVTIIRHGVDDITADSDAMAITICARPAAPGIGLEISPYHDSIIITVIKPADDTNVYQFAISRDRTGENLIWQDESTFTGLEPGTPYFVFVRIKHTENEPHSASMQAIEKATTHGAYVIETGNRLDALKQSGDGANVDAVIQNAKDAIDELSEIAPFDGYYAQVEAIIAQAESDIPLARAKDQAIAKLKDKVQALIDSGAYDQVGETAMEQILENAAKTISEAETIDQIQVALYGAEGSIDNVKVAYIITVDPITNNTVHIAGIGGGLSPDIKLTLSRYTDLNLLASKIDSAIKKGNVVVYQSGLTVASAVEALRTQDVMAAFKLAHVNGESMAESYEIRMLLPNDLKGLQSIRIGYYNEDTQKLEILESHIDGNYIVFVTNRITDFVIFGDPTISLTVAIAILGATLLLQLIAIVFLLICRRKGAKAVHRSYAFAPITALTIRFLPVNGLTIVVALAAAVVVTTTILIWLLLTTVIVRRGTKQEMPVEEMPVEESPAEDVPEVVSESSVTPMPVDGEGAMSVFDEPTEGENDPVLTTLTDSEIEGHTEVADTVYHNPYATEEQGYRYAYETEGEETEETEEIEEAVDEEIYEDEVVTPEEEADPFAVYDNEADDSYDFIEPAADPRYSLPDEEEELPETEEEWAEIDADYADETVLAEEAEVEYQDEAYFEEDSYEEAYAQDVNEEIPAETEVSAEETPYEETDEQVTEEWSGEKTVATEDLSVEAGEETEKVSSPAEEQYDEDELPDIDDSYLAQDEVEEELPDIDDSKLNQ